MTRTMRYRIRFEAVEVGPIEASELDDAVYAILDLGAQVEDLHILCEEAA